MNFIVIFFFDFFLFMYSMQFVMNIIIDELLLASIVAFIWITAQLYHDKIGVFGFECHNNCAVSSACKVCDSYLIILL